MIGKHTKSTILPLATLLLVGAASACTGEGPIEGGTPDEGATTESASAASLKIEQAVRLLDSGRDAPGAQKLLVEALADSDLSPDKRDEAMLALSRAQEAQGDKEAATKTIEDLLAAHTDNARWSFEEVAQERLYKLVTGSEQAPLASRHEDEPVAPIARALARYFKPGADGRHEISIDVFGGDDWNSSQLGTWNIAGGVRLNRLETCPLCDARANAHTGQAGYGSWTSIPGARASMANSLVVFHFNLDQWRIPARYDQYLPLPSAEIVKHLERGEGLLAAQERPGAPPIIVIAAPRSAQFAAVEEKLAAMTALPTAPVVVEVAAELQPKEIQATVRSKIKAYKTCYNDLLARAPGSEGKVVLKFAIGGDGTSSGVEMTTESPALRDATFERCMVDTTKGLRFPATGKDGVTTVTYPLELRSDPDR